MGNIKKAKCGLIYNGQNMVSYFYLFKKVTYTGTGYVI